MHKSRSVWRFQKARSADQAGSSKNKADFYYPFCKIERLSGQSIRFCDKNGHIAKEDSPMSPSSPSDGVQDPPVAEAEEAIADKKKRRLRPDVERNRKRIIAASREVLAAKGINAGFNEIAHHAGLGVGTMYRNFPDRDVLLEAVLRDEVLALISVIESGLKEPQAWDGLVRAFRYAVESSIVNRGLRDAVFSSEIGQGRMEVHRDQINLPLQALLERAQKEGSVRADLTTVDIVMLMHMLMEFGHRSVAIAPDAYKRYLNLVIGSFRTSPENATLGPDITEADAVMIARRWRLRSSES